MVLTRYAIALLGSAAILSAPALAAPGISISAGAGAGAHVGTPPVAAPPVGVPPVGVPPVGGPNVSHPPVAAPPAGVPRANTNASAHANANSAVVAGLPLHGTLTAVNGNTATVRMTNGATHSYKVSAQTAAALRPAIGKPLTFLARNDVLALPQHGTLTAVNGTSAVIKLAGGATQTFSIGADESAWLKSHVGKRIVFWTDANGSLQLDRGSNTTQSK